MCSVRLMMGFKSFKNHVALIIIAYSIKSWPRFTGLQFLIEKFGEHLVDFVEKRLYSVKGPNGACHRYLSLKSRLDN